MQWLKVREYAVKHGISNNVTYKKIKAGKLQSKKVKGVTYVADYDGQEIPSNQVQIDTAENEQNQKWMEQQINEKKVKLDWQLEKLKNLRQDTILKQLKQQTIKEKYRQQYCEGVLECFVESFADLKNFLIALKMEKQQLEQFEQIFKKDLKKFENSLKKYLQTKDNQEQEITDVEQ